MTTTMPTPDGAPTALEESTQPQASPDELRFEETVKTLLAKHYGYSELKRRLYDIVVGEAKNLSPIKVVYCSSFGGYAFSEGFKAYCKTRNDHHANRSFLCNRSDPHLLQAISDYGRLICDKFPFIADDWRTAHTWKLNELLSSMSEVKDVQGLVLGDEFDHELVTHAKEFFTQMTNDRGYWREDCLGSFSGSEGHIDLVAFTELHPDFWMSHYTLETGPISSPTTTQVALQFARVLREKVNPAKYQVGPDQIQGHSALCEFIGLLGASTVGSLLAIKEVTATLDYSIDEYDGKEEVVFYI